MVMWMKLMRQQEKKTQQHDEVETNYVLTENEWNTHKIPKLLGSRSSICMKTKSTTKKIYSLKGGYEILNEKFQYEDINYAFQLTEWIFEFSSIRLVLFP